MNTILVLGAGRSASSLISYLLDCAKQFSWKIVVGDVSLLAAQDRIGNSSYGQAIEFDIQQEESCLGVVATADVVISLLPPHFHTVVAWLCLNAGKHLLTASYVSDEMSHFHEEASKKNLLLLNECGLDPGIDHMSALQVISKIKKHGGTLKSFESFTGGLIAPDTDPENPWRYKFTWNPRNVVMAGQGTAKFLRNGLMKYIPYQRLFKRITKISIPGHGIFEGYANRDSLKYIDMYGLNGIETMLRGTLRHEGYCPTWDVLVQLGCCDDTYSIEDVEQMTHIEFLNSFLGADETGTVQEKLINQFGLEANGPEIQRLTWSGFFTNEKIGIASGTPARILEHILSKKWSLKQGDKDMIVMIHRFVAEINGKEKTILSTLVVKGEDSTHTAMAKTVGLPLGIAAKLLMQNRINIRGVQIPTVPEIYDPVMEELAGMGIKMVEFEE